MAFPCRNQQITGVSRALALDNGTDILLYFTCANSYTPTAAVTDKDGAPVEITPEKVDGGKFLLTIPSISAHKLGDFYTVSFDNGAMTIDICALSYAYSILNNSASSTNLKTQLLHSTIIIRQRLHIRQHTNETERGISYERIHDTGADRKKGHAEGYSHRQQ